MRGVGADSLDQVALEEASGVGVVVTREDIAAEVAKAVEEVAERFAAWQALEERRQRLTGNERLRLERAAVAQFIEWFIEQLGDS